MKLLLDTHTFIWWASEPKMLSAKVLSLCENRNNTLILSVVSVWEMQIKLKLEKLKIDIPIEDLLEKQIQTNGANSANRINTCFRVKQPAKPSQ